MTILVAIPLSIIIFAGQSVADVPLRTCVIPAAAVTKSEAISAKRWILVGVTSALVGFSFAWMTTAAERMMFGDASTESHKFINTFPPDLMPRDQLTLAERKMIMDFQGLFIRQHQKSEPEKSIEITMEGSATSFDEMVGLRLLATHIAELPDEERPKCVTIIFGKEFEAVFASFVQRHEWMVCDVPKGLPQLATIIDRRQSASWQIKYNTLTLLPTLLGKSGDSIRRFVPTAKNTRRNQ